MKLFLAIFFFYFYENLDCTRIYFFSLELEIFIYNRCMGKNYLSLCFLILFSYSLAIVNKIKNII